MCHSRLAVRQSRNYWFLVALEDCITICERAMHGGFGQYAYLFVVSLLGVESLWWTVRRVLYLFSGDACDRCLRLRQIPTPTPTPTATSIMTIIMNVIHVFLDDAVFFVGSTPGAFALRSSAVSLCSGKEVS